MNKKVLLLTIAFSPNIGGIETHFDDLITYLVRRNWAITVLTYKPITTNANAPFLEKKYAGKVTIYRLPWLKGKFYQLVQKPLIEFFYLVPGLFVVLPFLLVKDKDIAVIHSHGLIAGFVGVFWAKIFNKRIITTTHSIYHFPKRGLYRLFAKWIFNSSNVVLTLSNQSTKEIESLGIKKTKIQRFTYWIDLEHFIPQNKKMAKKELGMQEKFIVLFVGRLVKEKGVDELLQAAMKWYKDIHLLIIGTGPLESEIERKQSSHITYLGKIKNNLLPLYYNASDIVIVPSVHDEGFGRVILESLACGTPVIASNRGAIPDAMNNTVGRIVDITVQHIVQSVDYFFNNNDVLLSLSRNARKFALKRYSDENAKIIEESYL